MKETIKSYLERRSASDPQFAEKYANPKKSIEECCRFIMGEVGQKVVRENGEQCVGLMEEDCDVLGLAVHYYDEDDITIRPLPNGAMCMPQFHGATYEPTDEDRENAKKAALKRLEEEAIKELHKPKKKVEATADNQQTLF